MTYPLPSGWQEFKLKDIGFFLRGSGISKKDLSDTGTPAIRYGDIYTKYNFVIKDISSYTNSKGTEIKKGDILFTGSGETAESRRPRSGCRFSSAKNSSRASRSNSNSYRCSRSPPAERTARAAGICPARKRRTRSHS